MKLFNTKTEGFTLVEMIVALGLFAVVAVVALGALMKIISANNKAQSLQSAITNLNFALDTMSREMRVGSCYNLQQVNTSIIDGTSCDAQANQLSYNPSNNTIILAFHSSKSDNSGSAPCGLITAYKITNNSGTLQLMKATQTTCNENINSSFNDVLSDNIVLTGYYLSVSSTGTTDPYPMAVIRLSGYSGARETERTYFDVQTTISARLPNI